MLVWQVSHWLEYKKKNWSFENCIGWEKLSHIWKSFSWNETLNQFRSMYLITSFVWQRTLMLWLDLKCFYLPAHLPGNVLGSRSILWQVPSFCWGGRCKQRIFPLEIVLIPFEVNSSEVQDTVTCIKGILVFTESSWQATREAGPGWWFLATLDSWLARLSKDTKVPPVSLPRQAAIRSALSDLSTGNP